MQGITFNRTFVVVKQHEDKDYNDVVHLFRLKLNQERLGTKYPPLEHPAVQSLLVSFPHTPTGTAQLHAFYEDCMKAKCFSKYFYYKLNPEKYAKKIRR